MHLLRLACSSALLATATLLAQGPSKDTSLGTWPFLVGNMDGRIQELVDATRAADLDTIYVNVFRATGRLRGDLWITDSAKRWKAAWGPVRSGGKGIDLPRLIQAAHAKGLQVVGVVKCFDASVQPSDAAHRQYLLDVMDYLLESYDPAGRPVYDLDGLALDYIRWVGRGCSGKDARIVTAFLGQVKAKLGTRSLHAYLLAGRYTMDGPVYDGKFNSYTSVISTNRRCYGQDWEAMSRYVDVMMPMAYTADGSIYSSYALHKAYVRQVTLYCRMACRRGGHPDRRVTPAIATYTSRGFRASASTVDASVRGALEGGADGYQAFRYATLAPHKDWVAVLQRNAVRGPNRPVPALVARRVGGVVSLDARASKDFDQSSASLRVRFDFGNDGSFETAWLPNDRVHVLAAAAQVRRVGMQVRDADGHVGATVREIGKGARPRLTIDAPTIVAATGGKRTLTIEAGAAFASHHYLVLGTLSGSVPGTRLAPGLVLPLNFDGLTEGLLQAVNTPLLQAGLGRLDGNGRGSATFAVPPGLLGVLRFRTITWAAAGYDGARFSFASNAVGLVVL